MTAYLDIETSFKRNITVVGILKDKIFRQFVGNAVTLANLESFLEGVSEIYTYNGSRFDLPVIRKKLKLDIASMCRCKDLMYDCWRNDLYGGLKHVESCLGISRDISNMNGLEAMQLWERFKKHDDYNALCKLLYYNKEDVVCLLKLRKKLEKVNGNNV